MRGRLWVGRGRIPIRHDNAFTNNVRDYSSQEKSSAYIENKSK